MHAICSTTRKIQRKFVAHIYEGVSAMYFISINLRMVAVFLLILISVAVDSYCCSFSCWEV